MEFLSEHGGQMMAGGGGTLAVYLLYEITALKKDHRILKSNFYKLRELSRLAFWKLKTAKQSGINGELDEVIEQMDTFFKSKR